MTEPFDSFLGDRTIADLVAAGAVRMSKPAPQEPASIDIRPIGRHRILPVSFLPLEREEIEETIRKLTITTVDSATRILPNAPYATVVRLDLDLDLPEDVKAVFSPKSSIGRLDLNVRVMANRHGRYDETPYGYRGPLHAEIRSSSFPIEIAGADDAPGAALTQVRFVRAMRPERGADTLIRTQSLGIGLDPDEPGWTADLKDPTTVIRIENSTNLPVDDFWRRASCREGSIILKRNAFYILRSKETVRVEADECAVLRQIDTGFGTIVCHYAGFVDSGFGLTSPTNLVFEIRNPEHDMMVRDGQPICILETHRLDRPVETLYGQGRVSYQGQSIRLARCFAQA